MVSVVGPPSTATANELVGPSIAVGASVGASPACSSNAGTGSNAARMGTVAVPSTACGRNVALVSGLAPRSSASRPCSGSGAEGSAASPAASSVGLGPSRNDATCPSPSASSPLLGTVQGTSANACALTPLVASSGRSASSRCRLVGRPASSATLGGAPRSTCPTHGTPHEGVVEGPGPAATAVAAISYGCSASTGRPLGSPVFLLGRCRPSDANGRLNVSSRYGHCDAATVLANGVVPAASSALLASYNSKTKGGSQEVVQL